MEPSKIAIQQGPLSLSAEGSEDFVRDALDFWKEFLAGSGQSPEIIEPQPVHNAEAPRTSQEAHSPAAPARNGSVNAYENVYDTVDDKLKIIAHVPGSNKAEQSRNVALVLLYGYLLRGEEQTPSEAIRQACVDQGCFDSPNFAQHLKGLKSRVVMNTKPGGGYDVKLTAPGRRDAKDLVESLNGGAE